MKGKFDKIYVINLPEQGRSTAPDHGGIEAHRDRGRGR